MLPFINQFLRNYNDVYNPDGSIRMVQVPRMGSFRNFASNPADEQAQLKTIYSPKIASDILSNFIPIMGKDMIKKEISNYNLLLEVINVNGLTRNLEFALETPDIRLENTSFVAIK